MLPGGTSRAGGEDQGFNTIRLHGGSYAVFEILRTAIEREIKAPFLTELLQLRGVKGILRPQSLREGDPAQFAGRPFKGLEVGEIHRIAELEEKSRQHRFQSAIQFREGRQIPGLFDLQEKPLDAAFFLGCLGAAHLLNDRLRFGDGLVCFYNDCRQGIAPDPAFLV